MSQLCTAAVIALGCLVGFGGCGDDPPPQPAAPQPTAAAAAAANAAKKAADKKNATKLLVPMLHIEDRVACPTPTMAKPCDPKAPLCPETEFCVAAGNGNFCGPCPDRLDIRQDFQPRDFVSGPENRDPFQSYVLSQPGMTAEPDPTVQRDPTTLCRDDQYKAPTYSVGDLTLVGIVAQGTQRKVLMLDSSSYGHIIRKGDCVGREKAVVTEIGAGYVTFQLTPDPTNPSSRAPTELQKRLYQDPLAVGLPAVDQGGSGNGPVIAPPPSVVPSPSTGMPTPEAVPAPPPSSP